MIERRCRECGTWNGDNALCSNCGSALSPVAIAAIEEEKLIQYTTSHPQKKDKLDLLLEKARNSKYLMVRILFRVVYGVGILFFVISSAIASLVAWTAA